jgi:hypothetical protein
MSKAKEIFDGFFNLVKKEINVLDDNTKQLAIKRSEICKACPANIDSKCSKKVMIKDLISNKKVQGCGCYLPSKVLSPTSQCPANKW